MAKRRSLTRRSFLGRVVGGAVITGSSLSVFAEPAEAVQVTDADGGAGADPPGQGRTVPGLTDRDTGPANADPLGSGRGNRRRGITDGDVGARADPANRGRGITDADRSDRPGYGRSQTRESAGRGARRSGTGSGFFVGADGHILTSNHVVQGATSLFVTTSTGERLPATLVRASAATDIAVLRVDASPPRYLTLSSSRGVQSGSRVFTVGFPIASILGREPRYTEGTISALSGPGGEQTFFQISVPVQPGNSGGPLLNESGEVIGVIAASAAVAAFFQATGTIPQNLNWAVKSDYAAPMVAEVAPITYPSREAAIAAANAAVVFIETER